MIRVGIGGWTYAPWRGVFYPKELKQADELRFASRALTTIEINGTYYGAQKPASFRKWYAETPDDFVFAVKAPRFAVNRRELATAGDSIERFFTGGVTELGDKLGPVNWQFAPTKRFDAEDFAAFLELLPKTVDGIAIRHAVEVRHDSFRDPAFVALARRDGAAIVIADSDVHPAIGDLTADFVYVRLQRAAESVATGYDAESLSLWAKRAKAWAAGNKVDALAHVSTSAPAKKKRDVFIFMINGAKVRAPAAAAALIERIG